MADNGRVPFISQASENGSSEHNTRSFIDFLGGPFVLGDSTKGGVGVPQHTTTNINQLPTPPSKPQPPPSSEYPAISKEVMDTPPPFKRPRGRPPGSKNKPKSPVIESEEYAKIPKPVVIEIAPGSDVIGALISFAHHHQVHLTVVSASGTVSDVLVRHPLIHNGLAFPCHGLHRVISLSGTYINFHLPYSSSIPNDPPCQDNFMINLSRSLGVVYGGIVAGKVMAVSPVVVMATTFKHLEYHKVLYIDRAVQTGEGEDTSDEDSSGSICTIVSKNNA